MSYIIDKEMCIDCRLCVPECPDGGISITEFLDKPYEYEIDGDKCTECIEHNKKSKCLDVCPVDCIVIGKVETDEVLWKRVEQNRIKLST